MRVFLGLTEIAGYYGNLADGFTELGVRATFMDLSGHPYQYGNRPPTRYARWLKFLERQRTNAPRTRPIPWAWWKCLYVVTRLIFFCQACVRHDAFIFGFGSSFYSYRELPILRLLGKRIIYVFHGSDSRPSYLDGSEMALDRGLTIRQCIERNRTKKQALRMIERHADVIVSNPLSSHLHEKAIVSFFAVGVPNRPQDTRSATEDGPERPVRILHSPSHPEAKGTYRIREIIARLQAKGHAMEYVEITGQPNHVVLDELVKCDFVIDQLYSDTPMASFAAEAASFGKPAVVGGYSLAEFRSVVPVNSFPPTCFCHPDDVESAIERLIVDDAYRQEMGQQARKFVATYWSSRNVAERYTRLFAGQVPTSWIHDPAEIRYLHGACLPEERARSLVRAVVEEGGTEALLLRDKPALERVLVEFAFAETG